jgi:hypothetical protein
MICNAWCKNKYECERWVDISKYGVKFYKDATEKSLALANDINTRKNNDNKTFIF